MLALGLLVFALPVLVAYAQTAAIDSFNLAKAGLVAADGIVIDKDAISALEFTPRVGVQPTFTNKGSAVEVLPGITLTRNQTETEPRIFLASEYSLLGKAYLVAMVDPDAPSPENRTLAQVRHWIVPDAIPQAVTGRTGLYFLRSTTEAVAPYLGPGPDVGLHRYTILIFEQPTPNINAPRGDQAAPLLGFDIATYASNISGLKLVGGTYFLVGPFGTMANNGTYAPPQPGLSTSTSGVSEPTSGTAVSQSSVTNGPTGVPGGGALSTISISGMLHASVIAVAFAMLFA